MQRLAIRKTSVMENELLQSIEKELTMKERLTFWLNFFEARKIAGVIDLHHYMRVRESDKNYSTIQNGQKVGIDDMLKSQRKAIGFARENAEKIRELMKADEEGTLSEEWSDKNLLEPIESYQKEKKEGKE